MLVIRLTEMEDGTIMAETARQVIGHFRTTRDEVVRFLQHKAYEAGEQLRIVEDFDDYDPNHNLNFERLMRRRF